ncbi:ORF2 [Giant panda anellovirus]|uniref:ORF2 n=1 Tax=Giant panda anellovirus TaxID=2016460 RepID=A0A220IGL3_9VIRU|nr:ORF2 [Giant panda anellovirus]ASH99134.1 ORF2 [Giant panda anellovirus]
MNPADPRNDLSIQRDRWLVTVVASHNLWCDCTDYRTHIPGWPGAEDGDAAGTGAAGAGTREGDSPGEDASPTDSELVAVDFDLKIAEDTDAETG